MKDDCKKDSGINQVCDERFDHICTKLDRVLVILEGNGQPGMKVRLDRVEQRNKLVQWVFATFAMAVIAFGGWLLRVWEHVK